MNRDIKFKVWDKTEKEMWMPEDIEHIDFGDGFVSLEDCFIDFKDCELLEFTGLKDENGKEIYEGDIIKFSDNLHGYISFKEGKFIVNHIEFVPVKTKDCGDYLNCYEVVGTIYTTPEFLKEGEKVERD